MSKQMNFIKKHALEIFIFIIIIVLTRVLTYQIESLDYLVFLKKWYASIIENGGINSLGMKIGNYGPPYILLLTIGTYITSNALLWVKFISLAFDIIMAVYASLIVKHFKVNKYIKMFTYTLILPGVIINSAVLGQCDSIYTAFVLMFIYYILKNKNKLALFLFGIALSFKLQAIFVAPVILYLIVTKKVKLLDFMYLVIGGIILMLPSMLYGKNLIDIIQVYFQQTKEYNYLVQSSPNIYSFLNLNYQEITIMLKYSLALIVIIVSIFISLHRTKKSNYIYDSKTFIIKVMLLSVFVPYLLPGMLDRYFYMANILLLIMLFITERKAKLDRIMFVLVSIAYFIPVLTINFLSYNQDILAFAEVVLVSKFSSVINTFVVLILLDRFILTENINTHKNVTKM